MAVLFNEIPTALRVPLFYAEIGSAGAVATSSSRLLLIGQKLAVGTAANGVPVLVSSGAEDSLFGTNSMLAAQVRIARANAPFQEIWALPLADGAGAVAATGQISLTSLGLPVAQATTLVVYIDGIKFAVGVAVSDTVTTLGTKLANAINASKLARVTAANTAGVITLTHRHAGVLGNFTDLRSDLYGDEPAISSKVAFTAFSGGTSNPDISVGLSALGEDAFDWIHNPYFDTANLDEMRDFLADRWGPMQQLYGHAISFVPGTVGTLSATGLGRNDPHSSLVGGKGYPTACYEIGAALSARAARHLSDAPELSRPLQFLTLVGVIAPKIADRFARVDRNTLLFDGISTLTIAADDTVQIERLITTYRLNQVGFEDATFLDVNTLAQAVYTVRYLRSKVTNMHGRQALGDDSNAPIQGVSRPKDIRATIIAGYTELNQLAVVENLDVFENNLVVERNATDASRVDVYLPTDVMNQLRVLAVRAAINLQF